MYGAAGIIPSQERDLKLGSPRDSSPLNRMETERAPARNPEKMKEAVREDRLSVISDYVPRRRHLAETNASLLILRKRTKEATKMEQRTKARQTAKQTMNVWRSELF